MNFEQRKKEFVDKLLNACKGNYSCGRIWEAWQVGTMTQEDFAPLEESEEFINEVADAFSQSLSDYKKELVEEIVEKVKSFQKPMPFGNPDYQCYRLNGHEYDGYGYCKVCHNPSHDLFSRQKRETNLKDLLDYLSLLQKDKETIPEPKFISEYKEAVYKRPSVQKKLVKMFKEAVEHD